MSRLLLQRISVKIAFFVNGFIYANWSSRVPGIQKLFSADNQELSNLYLALSIGAVGAMPFTGWLIIKNGSRRITLLVAILYCIIVPLIPFVPDYLLLVALFLLLGIVTGMFDVAMNAQAVMVEQRYNKPIMTSFHAFFSIGMAVGAGCGALFAHFTIDIQYHFIIVAAMALCITLWLRGNLIQDKPDPSLQHDGPLFRVPNKAMVSVGLIAFCCMMAEGAMGNWSVKYMQNVAGASEGLAPISLASFATAMVLGRIFGDSVRSSVGDRNLIVLGGVLSTIGVSVSLIVPVPGIVIAGSFLIGLGLSTIVPITYSIAGNARDLSPGVGLAMVTTVGYTGFLIGPPVIGFIADWQSLRLALLVVAFLLSVMTILGAVYKPKR